jgi:transposase
MPAARRKAKRGADFAAVRRIDALFGTERSINGQSAEQRRVVRQQLSAPLVADLESWMREQRAKDSRDDDSAKAMVYMLKRWPAFTRFLDDGTHFPVEQRSRTGAARNCDAWSLCIPSSCVCKH